MYSNRSLHKSVITRSSNTKFVSPSFFTYFASFLFFSRFINKKHASVLWSTVQFCAIADITLLTTTTLFNQNTITTTFKHYFQCPHIRTTKSERFVNFLFISGNLFLLHNYPQPSPPQPLYYKLLHLLPLFFYCKKAINYRHRTEHPL